MTTFPQGFKVALLVSDDGVREAATAVLSACSYKVMPAASLDDCLQLCTEIRIDIVLAESRDLTADKEKTMQLMGALKNVPLIVMADSDTPSALFHGLKIGAVDFLKRPLDEAKVRSMWQHTLQKRMTAMPALEEGSPHLQRLSPTSMAVQQGTTGARATGPTMSEQSSSDPKSMDALPDPATDTAQNFPNDPQSDETSQPSAQPDAASASNLMEVTTQGGEQRKRSHKPGQEGQKRRIRPNLSTRDTLSAGSSSHKTGPSATSGMPRPPLLGIPPGCVPPVGSDGQAIGMPFLNRHPFVPSNPMSMSPLAFMPSFMYNPPEDPDLMSDIGPLPDVSMFQLPFPQMRPSSSSHTPPVVSLPAASEPIRDLHRVSSTPTRIQDDIATLAVSPQEPSLDVPRRPLQKSPSLVNF